MRRESQNHTHHQAEELRNRLDGVETTLRALRTGEVETAIVHAADNPREYPLDGAGHSHRVLIEAMNEGVATITEDGVVLYCNPRFARMLDAPLVQIIGTRISDYLLPTSRRMAALLREAARGDGSHADMLLRKQNGEELPIFLSVCPVVDGGRRLFGLVATDLTQQKQELDKILSSMVDSVLVFDTERNVVKGNAAAVATMGFDPVGMDRVELERRLTLRTPGGRPLTHDEYPSARALRGERVVGLRLVLVREETQVDFTVSCSPIRVGDRIGGAVSVWHDVTACKKTHSALAESEQEYRMLFEHSLEATFLASPDGRISDANLAASRLFGMSTEELCRVGRQGIVEPTDALASALEERRRTGSVRAEVTCIRKDGSRFPAEVSSVVVRREPSGERALVMLRDISERKHAEKTLQENEARFRSFFETPAVGTAELSIDGRFLEVNARVCEITGYSRRELLQMGPADLWFPEDVNRGRQELEGYLMDPGARSYEGTERCRHKDGRVIWLQVNAAILRDGRGHPSHSAAIIQDITGRKEAELELARAKERLERAQAAARIGTFEWDIATNRVVQTSGLEAVYGLTPGKSGVENECWIDRVHPDDRPRVVSHLADVVAGKTEYNTEYRILWPDGSLHWVAALGGLERDEAGRPARVRGVNMDVTERRQVTDDLRTSRERLKEALRAASAGTWEWDIGTRQGAWSEESYRLYGLNPADGKATYARWQACVHPEDRTRTIAAVHDVLEGRTTELRAEYRIHHPTQGERWIMGIGQVRRDADGRPLRMTGLNLDITDRKQAELRLAESESRFRTVIENSRDGINLLDLTTGRYTLMSPAQVELTGFTAEELNNLSVEEAYERVHPDDREISISQQSRVAAGEDVGPVEYRWKVKSGEYRWFSDSRRSIRDHQGRAVALVGVSRDITDSKRIEDQLRHQASLLDNLGDAVLSTDEHFRIKTWNKAAQTIYGYSEPEALGHHADEFLRTEFLSSGPDEVLRRLRECGQVRIEVVHRNKGGERLHIHANVVALRDSAGRVTGTLGILRDVTETYQLQEAIREQENHYRTLFEASPSGIVIIDADCKIIEFNERAHYQLGYTRDEFSRLTLSDIDCNESPTEARAHVAEILDKEVAVFETKHRTKTGEVRDIIVDVRALDVRHKKRLLSVWRDITEHKRAEQALRETDHNKNQFIAMLSHELRNPLAPIRNSLYVLDRAVPGGEQARRAKEVIERQVGHMCRLIDDLLDVTRVSRGKIKLQREDLDLCDVARRTIDDFRPGFEVAEIALELSGPPVSLPVYGDRTRIAQVVGNLLHNASKFTPRGGRVTLFVERDNDTREAVVRVVDDGAGISPEMLPRLFTPFSQAENTLDRSRGGLGLGLSLVKGLIELHGGTVSARSEGLGRGAEFCVRVPLRRGSMPPPAAVAETPTRRARRILIIEDNFDAADSLREVLEISGHEVAVAYNGSDGIERARDFHPDVVLCDIGLPGMHGYDVARAFRSDEGLKGAFLVALSGYAMPDDLQRASDAGFERHLSKPPDLEKLERIVGGVASRGG